jgi:hypothetical protein
MQKFGTGQILTEDGEPVRKTASVHPLTQDDVREIEGEGQTSEEE